MADRKNFPVIIMPDADQSVAKRPVHPREHRPAFIHAVAVRLPHDPLK